MERASDGARHELAVDRWAGPATEEERRLLQGLRPAVLDIGCGPGRIAAALAGQGVPSLGIDVSPAALASAAGSGAIVLERSVFDPLPGEGRWATTLLLDGNVGIGGDPGRLLRRVIRLLDHDGSAMVEVGRPGVPSWCDRVRLLPAHGEAGPWFRWAWVGADDIGGLAGDAGFGSCEVRRCGQRHIAVLHRAGGGSR